MPQNLKILQNYFKIVFSKKIILIFEKIFELNIKLIEIRGPITFNYPLINIIILKLKIIFQIIPCTKLSADLVNSCMI